MLVAWQIHPSPHTAKPPVCENHVAWDLHPCCRSPSSACTNCRKIQAKPDGNPCPHAKWWHMGSTHHCHGTFLLWSQSTSLSWYDQLPVHPWSKSSTLAPPATIWKIWPCTTIMGFRMPRPLAAPPNPSARLSALMVGSSLASTPAEECT